MDGMNFILNGQAHGDVASTLLATNFDPASLRPWVGDDGRSYISVNQGGKLVAVPTANATATLRKDDWVRMDKAIVAAAKPRLRLVSDLMSKGLQYSIPNGMGKTVLETETQSDISAASISMDGIRASDSDRPVFELTNLPLPIIHKDFEFSARQIAASRNGGSPLDLSTAELAGRRVAEMAEQLTIGTASSYAFGGGTIYGITNYPNTLTKTLTSPTASGWLPSTTVSEVLAMKSQSQAAYHYGPWMVYNSPAWDAYMDDDYSASKGDNTLRERIAKIDNIQGCRTLDYLTGTQLAMVQMTSDVIRMVVGMNMTTLQWDSHGGMLKKFKVMTILVPQLRADQNSNTGIVLGSV